MFPNTGTLLPLLQCETHSHRFHTQIQWPFPKHQCHDLFPVHRQSAQVIIAVRRRYRQYETPVSISTFCLVSVFTDSFGLRPDGSSGPFICKECDRWSECRNGIATEFLCGASRGLSSFRFCLVPIGIYLCLWWRELDSLVSKISFCASHFFVRDHWNDAYYIAKFSVYISFFPPIPSQQGKICRH